MRLFVAAELPSSLLDALAETSARLREGVRGRFVGTDLFHVTLAFLGEVPVGRVDEVAGLVEHACLCHEPMAATLGALGTFGRARRAVLWQGFAVGERELVALARDVRAALDEQGLWYDPLGPSPHVTLMRNADVAQGVLPMPTVARGTMDTVTVFRSDLSGERPRYEALARVSLG